MTIRNKKELQFEVSKAVGDAARHLGRAAETPFGQAILGIMVNGGAESDNEFAKSLAGRMNEAMKPMNELAHIYRSEGMRKYLGKPAPIAKSAEGVVSKAELDVGTLTDFSQITGGQSLGYVSLDTRLARSTVRPSSFTLYQHLDKSAANQVVDYWAAATSTGGALPGAAFSSYSGVGAGTLSTNAGEYELNNITLRLLVDGRAITTALAAQNSFVNVSEQETTNAALSILSSVNWANYFGNPTLYANQFEGLYYSIPAANFFDFNEFYTSGPAVAEGWSKSLTLFNLIYEAAAQLTSFNTFGHITHAFMSPTAMGSMEGLTQQQLNNILNEFSAHQGRAPIWDNGNLMGMRTRFGDIQYPIDLFITARDTPAQGILNPDGTNNATTTNPTPPASVTVTVSAAVPGSNFSGSYTPSGGGTYSYVVASCDGSMNESLLQGGNAPATGVVAGDGVNLVIAPPTDHTAAVFRVYRSGLGYSSSATAASAITAGEFRFIGEIAANGASNVTFTDKNAHIPGSDTIFLLDLDEGDFALDYRFLLPLSRIDLFAQSLYMPWAIATIGAIRNRIPKFHGVITNFVADSPVWDPLSSSNS